MKCETVSRSAITKEQLAAMDMSSHCNALTECLRNALKSEQEYSK